MDKENKFLIDSRERQRWKKKLAIQPKKEPKADSIYFRPTLGDAERIAKLAELTGETKNAVVEKLVAAALGNKTLTFNKLEEQKTAFRRLEYKVDCLADEQERIAKIVVEAAQRQVNAEKSAAILLSEIYCMVHTVVSLARTVLLQILNLTQKQSAAPSAQVLAQFDRTSDLTIARSIEDLEAVVRLHRLNPQTFDESNLFWKSKLKNNAAESQNALASNADELPAE